MKKLYTALLSLLLICLCTNLYAQRAKTVEPTPQPKSFKENVEQIHADFYQQGGFFEKLYIMTDKPYYSAGETIFFSGFLLHATLLTRISPSEFIYAELIDSRGELVERIKICAKNKQFVGSFTLDARLAEGKYSIRAYSLWMTNFDFDYLYSREVMIGNFIDDAIKTSISYEPQADGTVTAYLKIADQFSVPLSSKQFKYRTFIDGRTRNFTGKTNADGTVKFNFKPSENRNDGIEIEVNTSDRELHKFVQMPLFTDQYEVGFYPEGGNLIADVVQTVAFKAESRSGKSVKVTGSITDSKGEVLQQIESRDDGMGRFTIRATQGETYTATLTSADGLQKSFTLPQPVPAGCTVRVIHTPKEIKLSVYSATGDTSPYAAVIHSRGTLMSVIEDLTHIVRINNADLFDGISQVSIVDKRSMKIVAERLFFVNNRNLGKVTVATDKSRYEQRDRVVMSIHVEDSEGRAAQGNFAMSVTDNGTVKQDPSADNITSYMLLSSDLNKRINNVGSYFRADGSSDDEGLDLIMLTSGWRRYPISSILAGELPRIITPIEDSQRIRGSVFGLIGRAKKPSIVIMEPKTKFAESFELNESNNFMISGLDAFSTATYMIQALNKRGRDTTVRIKIESENYPLIATDYRREYYKEQLNVIPSSFLSGVKERYYYEGGMRVIDIDEIVVTAKKRPFFVSGNTGSMVNGDLSRFSSVYDALSSFKELDVTGTTITTREKYIGNTNRAGVFATDIIPQSGSTEEDNEFGNTPAEDISDNEPHTPELMINGNITHIDAIDNYDIKYVERLGFVDGKGAQMLGMGNAPYGVIMMEVSKEGMIGTVQSDAIAKVVLRGCQTPAEFYKPKYSTLDDRLTTVRDMRTTIAWEPCIRTDAAGNATVLFYTSDLTTSYDVILEGSTDGGELCRSVSTIAVERNERLGGVLR